MLRRTGPRIAAAASSDGGSNATATSSLCQLCGTIAAPAIAGHRLIRGELDVYRQFRRFLGRSILLGLELLVTADIVRTVAVTPSLTSIAALAAIDVIRTFLSLSLELEITGRWPWQKVRYPDLGSQEASGG